MSGGAKHERVFKHAGGRGKKNPVKQMVKDGLEVSEAQAKRIISDEKEIKRLRAEKLRAEIERINLATATQKKRLLPLEIILEDGQKLAAIVNASLDALVAALPGQLEGLKAAQMPPIIEREIYKARSTIDDALSRLRNDQ